MESKTKRCKYCQSEIDAKAKICPICQKKQAKIGFVHVVIIVIGIFVWFMFLNVLINALSSSTDTASDPIVAGETVVQETETPKPLKSNSYYIDIVSSRIATDYAGNDVLIIRYKFMHTHNEPKTFGYALDDKIYQNGIECQPTYWKSDEVTEDYKYSEIQPNTEIEFETTYGLNDLTSPVKVEIRPLFSKKVIFEQTIDLQNQ